MKTGKIAVPVAFILSVAAHAAFAQTPAVRTSTAVALPEATPFDDAISRLKTGNRDTKRQAADLLGQSRDPRAIPPLLKALGDPDVEVRLAVVDGLGMLRAKEAVGKLSAMLSKEPEARLRHAVVITLSYIGDPSGGPALLGALSDAHPGVRYAAVQTLGAVKYAAAEDELIALLQDPDVNMRRGAVSALGELRSKKAVAGLRKALDDEEARVRLAAIQALGEIGDMSVRGALKKSLEDADASVKMAAALALAKMNDPSGLAAAHEYAKSPDHLSRRQAIDVIVLVGDEKSKALLDELYGAEQDAGARGVLDYARQKLAVRLKALQKK